jgi:hypothetical protein
MAQSLTQIVIKLARPHETCGCVREDEVCEGVKTYRHLTYLYLALAGEVLLVRMRDSQANAKEMKSFAYNQKQAQGGLL